MLHVFYEISQIGMAVVILGSAIGAYKQIRSYKLLELLKYLEADDAKKYRRIVLTILSEQPRWWQDDPQVEAAASEVCAHFDVLAAMIEFDHCDRWLPGHGYGNFFRREWGHHIVNSHETLKDYIDDYRTRYHDPTRFRPFERLAERVIRDMEQPPGFWRSFFEWV